MIDSVRHAHIAFGSQASSVGADLSRRQLVVARLDLGRDAFRAPGFVGIEAQRRSEVQPAGRSCVALTTRPTPAREPT